MVVPTEDCFAKVHPGTLQRVPVFSRAHLISADPLETYYTYIYTTYKIQYIEEFTADLIWQIEFLPADGYSVVQENIGWYGLVGNVTWVIQHT
jgi:hypothetical protein